MILTLMVSFCMVSMSRAQFGLGLMPGQVAGTPTIVAVQSGDWTNPITWGGVLPVTDDRVSIPSGVTVTVASEVTTEFKSINIAGTLRFANNVNTELRCEYVHSAPTGTLEIGTALNPISGSVTARFVVADRGGSSAQDWWRYAPGLVLMGPVTMYGEQKTTWVELAANVPVGATSMSLATAPTNWKVGDKLVIAATTPQNFTSDDVVTIQSINGTNVTFSPATTYSHEPPAEANHLKVHVANYTRNIKFSSETTGYFGGPANTNQRRRGHIMFMHNSNVDMRYVEIENMGRTLKTEPVDDFQEIEIGNQVQVNLPFIPGQNGVPGWGPNTNPRGRYSVHFHRSLDGVDPNLLGSQIPRAVVQGVTVFDDPGWGFVSHSSAVDFIENASYKVQGGAFNTEAGDELGSFVNNIALRTVNPNDHFANPTQPSADLNLRENGHDFAFQGDAFWFHSNGIHVEGNIAAGTTGHSYVFWPEGLIEIGRGQRRGNINWHIDDPAMRAMVANLVSSHPDPELNGMPWQFDCWQIPAKPFLNNTAYSASKGVNQFYGHSRFLDNRDAPDPAAPGSPGLFNVLPEAFRDQLNIVIDGTKIWNIRNSGIAFQYSSHITLRNNEVYGYGNPGTIMGRQVIGIDVDHWHNFDNWVIENNTVKGFGNGGAGIAPPDNARTIVLQNNVYDNPSTDLQIGSRTYGGAAGEIGFEELDWINMPGDPRTKRFLLIQNETFMNSQENIVMEADLNNSFTVQVEDGFIESNAPKNTYFFLYSDSIVLNGFGGFNNARVYFNEQDAGFIPINNNNYQWADADPATIMEFTIPVEYRNKTNLELTTTGQSNGRSFGGEVTPAQAVTNPMIINGKVLGGPLSVSELENGQSGFQMYPNPTEASLVVSSNFKGMLVKVLSTNGRVVRQLQTQNSLIKFDLSDLSEGVYFVEVINDQNRKIGVKKLIKSH